MQKITFKRINEFLDFSNCIILQLKTKILLET